MPKVIKESSKQPENDHVHSLSTTQSEQSIKLITSQPNKAPASASPQSPSVIRAKTLSDPFVDLRDGTMNAVEAIFLKQEELDNERIDKADRQDRLDAMWEEEMKEREEGYRLAALDLRVERELKAVREMIRSNERERQGKASSGK